MKSAHFGQIATRLDNLEQKLEELEPPEGGIDPRFWEVVFAGAQSSWGGSYDPSVPIIYDSMGSLYNSIFGTRDGVASPAARNSAQFTPFYDQVFQNDDTRFFYGGGWNDGPAFTVANAAFGSMNSSSWNADYFPVMKGDAELSSLRSICDTVFGTPDTMTLVLGEFRNDSLFSTIYGSGFQEVKDTGSFYEFVKALEARVEAIETYLTVDLDARLQGIESQVEFNRLDIISVKQRLSAIGA